MQLDVEMKDISQQDVKSSIAQEVAHQVKAQMKSLQQTSTPSSSKVSSFFQQLTLVTKTFTATKSPRTNQEEEANQSFPEGPSPETGSWRRAKAEQAWQECESTRQNERTVSLITSKPWSLGKPNTYPDEILSLPFPLQVTTLLSHANIGGLEQARHRGIIHVQPGVDVPYEIQHDLSASLKFMFETKINGSLISNTYTDLVRQVKWR